MVVGKFDLGGDYGLLKQKLITAVAALNKLPKGTDVYSSQLAMVKDYSYQLMCLDNAIDYQLANGLA